MSRGLGSTNAFQPLSPLPLPFPHPRIQPRVASRHHGIAIMPLGLCLPQMPCRCYNPEQVSVRQITGKPSRTGEITLINYLKYADTTCPKKLGPASWQYDPGHRVNSPLDPRPYQVLIVFLMTPTLSWPGIPGFAYL